MTREARPPSASDRRARRESSRSPRATPRRGVLLALAVLGTVVMAPGSSEGVPDPPASGASLGAYVRPDGWSRREQRASIHDLEAALGRRLDIDHLFYPWSTPFPGWRQGWDIANGRIPMISWAGTDLDQIVSGASDAILRERANGLSSLEGTVILRWFGEMDADVYDGREIASPAQFVTAWRRVHDIFVNRGATNVEWVWCPNASAFSTGEAQRFYPGDAYVDWICADGYNWAPARPNARWVSFRDVFASFYAWAADRSKPLMIGETGVLENGPGDKAAWITDMGDTIESVYPQIKALVYFDAYATANFGGWYDWRIDTSPGSFDAFRALAADPYFGGAGGG